MLAFFCNEAINNYDGEGCGENNGEQGCVRALEEGEFNVEGPELTFETDKSATSLKLAYLSSGLSLYQHWVGACRLLSLQLVLHHWPDARQEMIKLPGFVGDEKTNA